MRLLIVEDNYRMREFLKSIFKFKFTEIRECEDGETALSEYELFNPDWVFMDIEMKKMDGITASKEILMSHPDARIIIITSHNNPDFKKEAISAGVRHYILKENILDMRDIF